jgi:hypothetical protein
MIAYDGGDPMADYLRPKARDEDIVVQEMPDELLVYDKQRFRLHTLNRTAAWVWQQLDGQTDTQTLAARLGEQFPELAGQSDHVLWASLKRLDDQNLLAERLRGQIPPRMETRRKMLKRMGLALALLPVVTTLVAPPPAQALTANECDNVCGSNTNCGLVGDCTASGFVCCYVPATDLCACADAVGCGIAGGIVCAF